MAAVGTERGFPVALLRDLLLDLCSGAMVECLCESAVETGKEVIAAAKEIPRGI